MLGHGRAADSHGDQPRRVPMPSMAITAPRSAPASGAATMRAFRAAPFVLGFVLGLAACVVTAMHAPALGLQGFGGATAQQPVDLQPADPLTNPETLDI